MAESQSDTSQTLNTIFHQGLDLYNKITNSQEATNSPETQKDIRKAIELFEQATRLVSLADIFSSNEELEELATNDIQYLLLPALLGQLTSKITTRDRKEVLNVAEVYYKDFLRRTNQYKLSNYKFEGDDADQSEDAGRFKTEFEELSAAVNTRATKIQKFKEQKVLKQHLESLRINVQNEHADEQIKRQYFLTMIRVQIHEVVDELETVKLEKPILEHMATLHLDKPSKRPPPPPLKPIIITKDAVQKAIYGAGYPSLPTMTVDEFYTKRIAEGVFPDPSKPRTGTSLQEAALAGATLYDDDKEAATLEEKTEKDDEENLARMRAKDEFKDEHRRGWGNRMNRS